MTMDNPGEQRGKEQATNPVPSPEENPANPVVTYTQEQLEARLTAAGRDEKSLATQKAALEEEKLSWQRHQEEALRDDPPGLTAFRESREQATKNAERERLITENARLKEGQEAIERQTMASEIAAKHKVDAASLLKFTDGSPSKMEELAKQLPKVSESEPVTPYSGKTDGGKEAGPPTAKGKIRAGWDSRHP